MWSGLSKKREQQDKTDLKIVLFIGQTKDGKLVKLVREVVTRLESMMGSG